MKNSIGISLVEPIFDDDGNTANTEASNIVTNKGPTEVKMVAYERKKRNRNFVVWKDFVEI